MTEAEEKTIAEREALLSAWRSGVFCDDVLQRVDQFVAVFATLATAQRGAAQSVADDAAQMRLAAERAPAAQRASDIARDAVVLFADRYTVSTKGDPAIKGMAECVELARLARKLAETP